MKLTGGYLALVALPLIVMYGSIEMGKSISAPPAVRGSWTIEWLTPPPCPATGMLRVRQSGPKLDAVVVPAAAAWHGLIDGSNFHLTGPCVAGRSGTLRAGLPISSREPAKGSTLSGRLTVDGCPACPVAEFQARAVPKPSSRGAGH